MNIEMPSPTPADTAASDPSPDCSARDACASAGAITERDFQKLDELADLGMDLLRSMRQRDAVRTAAVVESNVPEPAGWGHDVDLAFDRIARGIRLTIALKAKLGEERLEDERKAE